MFIKNRPDIFLSACPMKAMLLNEHSDDFLEIKKYWGDGTAIP